jgi:hypothetical protein
MASLSTVRGALYTRLSAAVTGVTTANVYRYELASVDHPAVIVGFPDRWVPDALGNVTREFTFPIRCEVAASSDWASGNVTIEALIEAVITAIQYDTSLGGSVDDCAVVDVSGFGFRSVGTDAMSVLVAEVNVAVLA